MPIPPSARLHPAPTTTPTTFDLPFPSSSSSSSSPVYPSPTPTSSPDSNDHQQALFVNLDGSPRRARWSRDTLSPAAVPHSNSRKGKWKMLDADVDQAVSERHVRARSSDGPDSPTHALESRINYPDCNELGNAVLSCYPTSNVSVTQGGWTKFIWNARIPEFIGLPGNVDIYLHHADSGSIVKRWTNIPNVQNEVNVVIDDSFWDYRMLQWQPGQQIPYTYYFVIVKAGTEPTGGEPHQATWTAIQTAYATSYYASLSAAASTASLASVSSISTMGPTSASWFSQSSLSSASLASVSATATAPFTVAPAATPTAGLQGGGDDPSKGSGFPAWAIALLVVLGFLALLSMAGLAYLLIRNYRRRQVARRESMGSSSPMMGEVASGPESPVTSAAPNHFRHSGPLAAAGAAMAARSNSAHNDAASTQSVSDAGPFSGQDAMVMADAFRKALRKPDFGDRPLEEGESPDTNNNSSGARDPVLSRELAEEGRDIRSVSSVRGVTIQGSHEEGEGSTTTTRKPS